MLSKGSSLPLLYSYMIIHTVHGIVTLMLRALITMLCGFRSSLAAGLRRIERRIMMEIK